jgi:hypothetical protein
VAVSALAATSADYHSAEKKFQSIDSGRLRAGSRIHLSSAELNAYVEHEVPMVTGGVTRPVVKLVSPGIAQGSALIDFAQVQRSRGEAPGWIMSHLLEGQRPVSVTARIRSGGGRATVDVLSLTISGVTVNGSTLDFLIHHFLLPLYPDAAVGRPFELDDRIDRIEVLPTGVTVVIGR